MGESLAPKMLPVYQRAVPAQGAAPTLANKLLLCQTPVLIFRGSIVPGGSCPCGGQAAAESGQKNVLQTASASHLSQTTLVEDEE